MPRRAAPPPPRPTLSLPHGATLLHGGATLSGNPQGVADITADIRASAHMTVHIERLLDLGMVLSALVTPLGKVPDGQLIESIAPVYETLLSELQRDPSLRFQIPWRNFEEVIAASYRRRGIDAST